MDGQQLGLLIQAIDRITAIVTSSGGGLSTKVPYTGANQAVDLNTQTLTSGQFRVNDGTVSGGIQIRSLVGSASQGAIYISKATPSAINFSITADASTTVINDTGSLDFKISNVSKFLIMPTSYTLADASNVILGSTTGNKIGTATTQKLGFWNATPVVQQTTAIVGAAFAANTSGLGDGSATYGGYTGGQIVAALKLYGMLA